MDRVHVLHGSHRSSHLPPNGRRCKPCINKKRDNFRRPYSEATPASIPSREVTSSRNEFPAPTFGLPWTAIVPCRIRARFATVLC